jgi:pimeloyl-ACP methyl ester carboxylesterase
MSERAERAGRGISFQRTGSGPALLLVPGIGGGAQQFGTLPRRFARAGFTCLTMTPVGIAPSDPLRGAFDLEDAARDLLAVVAAAAAGPCLPVGVSFGGKVALTACALAPQELPALAMLGSSAIASPRAIAVHRFFATAAARLSGPDLAAVLAPFLFGRTFHERRPDLLQSLLRSLRPDAAARALMVAQAESAIAFDGTARAAQVRGPALLLAGAEDTLTSPADVRASAALLPNARYLEIEGAGHTLLLESRAAFDAVVAFAREVFARG